MICLWVETISLTENAHMITHKEPRYLLNKLTYNNYLVVSQFIWREFRLSTLTNWNHPPYLWHNFILVYTIKLIRMLALLWHIFVLFFNLFLQMKLLLHYWQLYVITRMVAQSSILVHHLFIYCHVLL